MKLKRAIKILNYHQRWRRGADIEMRYEPKELTEAIDVCLEKLNKDIE